MLTIEIKDANQINQQRAEIEIYCDAEGLGELQRQLNFLVDGETHVHLASRSWAGTELSETPFGKGNVLVHQATIVKIPG
jgi:hypothetical protein